MGFGVDLFWPGYLAAALAIAAVWVHLGAYRRTTRPVSAATRRTLLALRLAAVALVLFVLWRPAVESRQVLSRKGRLALLVDSSRSMSIGDEESPAPCSRLARAAAAFAQSADLWTKITQTYDIDAFSFSKEVSALPASGEAFASRPLAGLSADGPVTALGDAMEKALRGSRAPQAILILSDGLSNAGIDPVDTVVPPGTSVFAIGVGKDRPTESTRDVSATGVFAPVEAFVSSDVPVVGAFSMTGLEGRPVKVRFLVNGEQAGEKDLLVEGRQSVMEAAFTFKPENAGPTRLEIRADPLPDEVIAANNSAATYVDVKKGALKAVYLEGTFRWEAKFLRLALESARDVEVKFIVPKSTSDAALAQALDQEWDVLIVGDIPVSFLNDRETSMIVEAVASKGRGILFLAGASGLGAGGYGDTPLAACVPFMISNQDRVVEGLYRVSARPQGPYDRLIALGEEGSLDIWEKLPPLLAVSQVGDARPGASVLLQALPVVLDGESGAVSPDSSRGAAPFLAVQDFGKGRAAAATGEGTWQWATGAGLAGDRERDEAADLHGRFWRQLVFWLARREERGETTMDVTLAAKRIEVGRPLGIEVRVFDSELAPVTDAVVTARATVGDNAYTGSFRLEDGVYKCELRPSVAGDYYVKVSARRADKTIAEAETAFVATATDMELATLVARPSILEGLARATGGKFAMADGAAEVFSDIHRRAQSSEFVRLQRGELWSSWWYVLAVVALLAAEWGLRKAAGLV